MSKPRVFIASSKEAIDIAKAIELELCHSCECTVWDSGVFKLSKSALESLEQAVASHEFAVLVLTPDDIVTSRGKPQLGPRDNLLFELGLFVGRWGRERTYIACDPVALKIPSDWFGITVAAFDLKRAKRTTETCAAVSPACTEILHAIRSAPPRAAPPSSIPISSDVLPGLDELYLRIAAKSRNQSAVIVAHTETSWVWKLFPTLLEWRLGDVPVTVYLVKPGTDEKHARQERYRRGLITNLGVRLIERKSLPLSAFFLDATDESNIDALVVTGDPGAYSPAALRYHGNGHVHAARALLARLPTEWRSNSASFRPCITRAKEAEVIKILRSGVAQYKTGGITILPKTVNTSELSVISRYTRAYKYQQIEYLARVYKKLRIDGFKTLKIHLKDESYTIVTPPVVEETRDGLVVLEGNTRATYCYQNKIKDFFCLLVKGVKDPLPGKPYPIGDVIIAERSLPPAERMSDFDYSRFRHIERAVHPY